MDYLLLLLLLPVNLHAARNKRGTSKAHLCFPIIGDMGGLPYPPFQTTTQKDVAALLSKVNSQLKCKFIIGVGDNFYYNGVTNTSDPRFYLTFERTYATLDLPWYMIAGNHDHYGNVSAQIEYSKESKRWKFPFYYHSEVHAIPDSNRNIEIVMIDTTILCWRSRKSDVPKPEVQMEWIRKKLSESTSDYLIVAGHHPVLSAGIHGNTDCLISKLKPLLEKYKVTAYFSGHDHNLQHIKEDQSDVHYFVTGSGNFVDGRMVNKNKLPSGSLKFENANFGGFVLIRATGRSLKVQVLNSEPKELWQLKLYPRDSAKKKISKNDTYLDSFQRKQINLAENSTPATISKLYNNMFSPNYGNSYLRVSANSFYYNNLFYPNLLSPSINLNYAPTYDIMQFANTGNAYKLPEMMQYQMMQYNSQLNSVNPYDYMRNDYRTQNNPINRIISSNMPSISPEINIEKEKRALNWMVRELNASEALDQGMQRRSVGTEPSFRDRKIMGRIRRRRSSQNLYRILNSLR